MGRDLLESMRKKILDNALFDRFCVHQRDKSYIQHELAASTVSARIFCVFDMNESLRM